MDWFARYGRSLAALDESLRRLYALLEAKGVANQTIVAFTADHGESPNGGRYCTHRGCGQRFELFMRAPALSSCLQLQVPRCACWLLA